MKNSPENSSSRLLSLDFFRGLTMFLLVAEGTGSGGRSFRIRFAVRFWNISLCNLSIIPGTGFVSGI